MAVPPRDQHAPTAATPVFSTSFALTDLARVRNEVEVVGRRCGLGQDETEDWVTAVNELLINAIRHGGGGGSVRLLLDDQLMCEVTDQGRGFNSAHYVPGAERPPLSGMGGMGLWMVGQLADYLFVASGPAGTTIRIAARTRNVG
ncbi:ATP-binding protein [Micromonospora sp. NPDC049230]|uniref:ATP-binding protein n=1 Tax=Micromonospora sp. NPDC049230 TaxID=3155502 RepID=UPI003408A27E